jgi:hypothetical protein
MQESSNKGKDKERILAEVLAQTEDGPEGDKTQRGRQVE